MALSWAGTALNYSKCRNRTEEVRDALQHQARFQRNPKIAAHIQAVPDQWSAANSERLMASKLQRQMRLVHKLWLEIRSPWITPAHLLSIALLRVAREYAATPIQIVGTRI